MCANQNLYTYHEYEPFRVKWHQGTMIRETDSLLSRFLVSRSVRGHTAVVRKTGKCLFVWEFPTAIKRVSFSDDDEQIVCITEQHIGYQGAIRMSNAHRDRDRTVQACSPSLLSPPFTLTMDVCVVQRTSSRHRCFTQLITRRLSVRSRICRVSS